MKIKVLPTPLAAIARCAPAVAVFAAVTGLALAGGGYGDTASGAMTALIWLALLVSSIALPGERRHLPVGVALATASLGFIAFLSVISIGFTPDPAAAFGEAVRIAGYAGVILLVALRRREDGAGMIAGLAAAIALIAVVAISSRLLGVGAGDAALAGAYPGSAGRLSYPVGYWNGLGALMALGVPLLAWLGTRERWGAGWTAALVPVLAAMYMTASRGAVLAALLGVLFLLALSSGHRRQLLAVLAVGVVASVPALAAVQLGDGLLTDPFAEIGAPELSAAVIVALSAATAYVLAVPAGGLFARVRLPRGAAVVASALVVAGLLAALAAIGPGRVAEEFTAISSEDATSLGVDGGERGGIVISASGSGRAQFWDAALGAFASEPLRGIGAGGFESYWTRQGDLEIVIRSAHSEPIELLAELGPLGLLAFLAFFAVVFAEGFRWHRAGSRTTTTTTTTTTTASSERLVPAVCMSVLVVGSVGVLIDWSWDLPVLAIVMLISAGILLTGRSGADAGAGRPALALSVPAPLVAVATILTALPIVWAGAVSSASSSEMSAAEAAYERGHLGEAVLAARSAARIQPWSAEPWERIAIAERVADNDEAALRAALIALRRAPERFELWGLAAELSAAMGADEAARVYAERGEILAPRIYSATFGDRAGSSAER